jgi:asparagine synthase (glutamine-hydrolysing)
MCGIVAASPSLKSFSHKTLSSLSRRGPDGFGFWVDDEIHLGHTRLAIIGLNERGREPLESENFVLSFNGEIYNYAEFKPKLKSLGYPVDGANDSETLLYCWEEWGLPILREMTGFWAFSIYDKRSKKITLVRDQFGIKPLYYYRGKEGFAAASLMRTVIDLMDEPVELDYMALSEYVRYQFTFGDKTFVKQIRKVLPGHAVVVDLENQTAEDQTYEEIWTEYPDQRAEVNKAWVAESRELFQEWILESTESDTPLTTIISGGIDSSLITRIVKPNQAYHAYFSDPDCNELPWAELALKGTSTELIPLQASDSFNLVDRLNNIIDDFDELSIGSVILPLEDLLAKVTENYKVVMVGTGGDELFGGYSRYQLALGACHQESYMGLFKRMQNIEGHASRFEFTHTKGNIGAYRFYEPQAKEAFFEAYEEGQGSSSPLESMLTFDRKYFLRGLLNIDDKMCGRHSLEGRPSFLHQKIVRRVLSAQQEGLMPGEKLKPILREISRGIIPDAIADRSDKMGFTTPIGVFQDNSADAIKEQLKYSKFKELYDLNQVEFKSASKYSREVFGLLALDLWLNKYASGV